MISEYPDKIRTEELQFRVRQLQSVVDQGSPRDTNLVLILTSCRCDKARENGQSDPF